MNHTIRITSEPPPTESWFATPVTISQSGTSCEQRWGIHPRTLALAHTHTCTHTRTHAHTLTQTNTHTHTHTHTHSESTILINARFSLGVRTPRLIRPWIHPWDTPRALPSSLRPYREPLSLSKLPLFAQTGFKQDIISSNLNLLRTFKLGTTHVILICL